MTKDAKVIIFQSGGTLISQIESSGSIILFYGIVSNAAWASATHNPSAGTYFWANLTYTV